MLAYCPRIVRRLVFDAEENIAGADLIYVIPSHGSILYSAIVASHMHAHL